MSRQHSSAEVFRAFLKLGFTSFGGPVAHLGYFREEFVLRRAWLSDRQYVELVALCQFLPGPASSQVGFALGLMRGGALGALAAWTAFTLPSAMLLVLFAVGALALEGPLWAGLLLGLKAVAVSVVAHAVWGMARTLTPDLPRIAIGVAGAALALLLPSQIGQFGAIAAGLVAGSLWCRRSLPVDPPPLTLRLSRRVGVVAFAVFAGIIVGLPILDRLAPSLWTQIADAFTRAGAAVFGGGHVVLPLLQAEPAIAAAVPPEQFIAGYGAAQAVPGPLFTFAAYLGFEMGSGWSAPPAALLALVAVFVPGILLLLAALPFWNGLRARPLARAAMAGANAAVVGILAAALWDPVIVSGVTGPASLVIAAGGLLLLALARLPAWSVVLAAAAAGLLAGLLGIP